MSSFSRRSFARLVAGTAFVGLVASACGTTEDQTTNAPGTDADAAFPVTIDNTFGATTIDAKPERIVTLGWNAQDVVYALGLTPVAMPRYTYGATSAGVMPWIEKNYDPAQTTLLDTADGAPFEAIAAARPDVILSPYEGFDAATYKKLSAIAPTVAYPDKAWQTSWQDQTTIIGRALGRSDDADKLVADTKGRITEAAEAHPEFAGKSLSVAYFGKPEINVYTPTDPRVQLLTQLGFADSAGVTALPRRQRTSTPRSPGRSSTPSTPTWWSGTWTTSPSSSSSRTSWSPSSTRSGTTRRTSSPTRCSSAP
jgi:iron complex transport system substrate-binding protein